MQQTPHTTDASSEGYRTGTRTDIGLRRQRNEDYLDVARLPHGLLMIVCDGMGGHRGGERASRLAVETFIEWMKEQPADAPPEELMHGSVKRAGDVVMYEALIDPEYSGMGTTLVAALVRDGRATIANVGDSRAYLFHAGKLQRITSDHSYVWELVQQGKITEEQAEEHPQRNIITRALGSGGEYEPDIFEIPLGRDDVLLLSSDGLHGMISAREIAESLAANTDPARACDDLVKRALAAGGKDNVSVALLRVDTGAVLVEPPTDPGSGRATRPAQESRGKGGGTTGKLLSVVLVIMIGVALWYFWLEPVLSPDIPAVPDTLLVRQTDTIYSSDTSLPVPDSMIYSVTPEDDMVYPGDTIGW